MSSEMLQPKAMDLKLLTRSTGVPLIIKEGVRFHSKKTHDQNWKMDILDYTKGFLTGLKKLSDKRMHAE